MTRAADTAADIPATRPAERPDAGRPEPWDQPYSGRLDAWERAPGPLVLALMAAAVLAALLLTLAIEASGAVLLGRPRRAGG